MKTTRRLSIEDEKKGYALLAEGKLSQAKIAKLLKTSRSTVAHMAQGRRRPSDEAAPAVVPPPPEVVEEATIRVKPWVPPQPARSLVLTFRCLVPVDRANVPAIVEALAAFGASEITAAECHFGTPAQVQAVRPAIGPGPKRVERTDPVVARKVG